MDIVTRLHEACRERLRIAVVGDAMVDRYVHGDLQACQDGCPKFMARETVEVPGGAANAVTALKHWNVEAKLFSLPGPCPLKARLLVDGKIVFRYDEELRDYGLRCNRLAEARVDLCDRVREFTPHALLVCDYNKGTLNEDVLTDLADHAHYRDIPIIADACREPSFYRGCLLKCNDAYSRKFNPQHFVPNLFPRIVVTHGQQRPAIVGSNGWTMYENDPPMPASCVNHVGAGDAFGAHLTLGMAHGLDFRETVALAHSAGRVYVQHLHNRAPWPHEIRRDLDPVMGKVVPAAEVGNLRKSLMNKKVVAANGVFRIPHAGHSWLMNWARQQGDVLVALVNSDASARRCKPEKTILPLAQRLQAIASQTAVDYVVVFDEDTPVPVLDALRPWVLVKGRDSEDVDIPGRHSVSEMLFAPESPFPDHSSDLESLFSTAV